MRAAGRIALAVLLLLAASSSGHATDIPSADGAVFRETSFDDLDGWTSDDLAAALHVFAKACRNPPRAGRTAPGRLDEACRAASQAAPADARRFFESRFRPVEVRPPSGTGFLTGYFEPEIAGAPAPSISFSAPLLAMPEGWAGPLPERGAIEDGALGSAARPIVYVDPVDAFVVHVQGSARIRLPDGSRLRVAFAGRNGQPYTSAGRVLAERIGVPPREMTADRLTDWLRDHPADGRDVMRQNRSYIFFRRADELDSAGGPVGAAGTQLTAGRSLAVDRTIWAYGLPVWLDGTWPLPEGGASRLRRLVVAEDTGAAITGPARGDLFVGTGAAAGLQAGLLREPVRFVVLWPR